MRIPVGRYLTSRTTIAILIAAPLLILTHDAAAQCTQQSEADAVTLSAKQAALCNNKSLATGPGATCSSSIAPTCADSLVADAIALGYGPNNPPTAKIHKTALADQFACQQQIGKAAYDFIGKKLQYRIQGKSSAETEVLARAEIDRIPDFCMVPVAQDVSGVVLPAVGPQCAAALGPPGTRVDPVKLRDCLLTLFNTWVDRVAPNPQPLRPNIVLILTDDQRWDTLGSEHSSDRTTPVMSVVQNELVASGVKFTNGFVTTSLCCPSRASILSGQYAHSHGVLTNNGPNGGAKAFRDASTLATWLQGAGYRTGLYGKYLNRYQDFGIYIPPGWNEWHAFSGEVKYFDYKLLENGVPVSYGSTPADYSTDILAAKAVQFIKASAGQPFFLYFAAKPPHEPATPAPRHTGLFAGVAPWRPPSYNEADVSHKPQWVRELTFNTQAQAKVDALRINMLESLQAEDEAVAAIMKTLRDLNLMDNTFVVFTSDNGYAWGEHRWHKKNCPYDECTRVPLVIRYPKLAPLPRVETRFGLNIDLAPTFAELAGATPPAGVEGQSMVRLLDGTAAGWRQEILTEGFKDPKPFSASARNFFWDIEHLKNPKRTFTAMRHFARRYRIRMLDVATPAWGEGTIPEGFKDPKRTFASVRNYAWQYTEYRNGDKELYHLAVDPYELQNVLPDPANASLVATMAARLRELYPGWPLPAVTTRGKGSSSSPS